jgi:ribosomal protein S18 acetylase RimI-like enzyme
MGWDGPMDKEAEITDLRAEDLPAIGALFAAHTGRAANLTLLGSWIETSPSAAARVGDRLVGYMVCKPFAPDVIEMAALLVDPGARDRGIGSRLIVHTERSCIARGLEAAVLVNSSKYQVLGPKRSTRPLFERMGYRVLLETPASTVMGRTLGSPDR